MSTDPHPTPVPEEVVLRFSGEDVIAGNRRVNVRQVLGEALGVDLDDGQLSAILRALRRSLVPADDVQRGLDGIHAATLAARQALDSVDAAVVQAQQLLDGVGRSS